VYLIDYNALFGPLRTEVLAALTAILPAAVGVFAVILGIRIGVAVLTHFLSGDEVEEE